MNSHPEWLDKACFYEIYPQSFLDTNNDGIGDLKGIEEKLDYIKGVGFNALWLNPIFESTFFDAGYDVSDYKKVATRYGGNIVLTRLIKACHHKKIKLLLDLVPGHTAIDHPWFKESMKDEKNPYSERYIWTTNVWECPKDLNCIRGFSQRNGACITNFFSIQPALNYGFTNIENPDFEKPITAKGPQDTIKAMIDVIRFYLKQGVDGFRVDMAGWLVKRDPEGKGTMEVWKQIFKTINKEFPEAVFVSEWCNPRRSLSSGFDMDFLLQDEFNLNDSLLTRCKHPYFRFHETESDSKVFMDYFEDLYEVAKSNGKYLSLISGNHDTIRIAKSLNNQELKFYYAFMYTVPNVPFMYYGDELGMKYEEHLKSVEGGYQRTGSRSPMQWTKSTLAGFTRNKNPYISINPDRKGLSVEEESKDSKSLLWFVKELLTVKKEHPALDNNASFRIEYNQAGQFPLVYTREKGDDKVMVVFNPTDVKKVIPFNREKVKLLLKIGKADLADCYININKQSLAIFSIK
jgi:glycosidase